MSRIDQIRFAAHAWNYALGGSIRTLPDGPARELLIVCEEQPTPANIRTALAIGRGGPWLPLIESALVEVGLVAIEDILKEAEDEHRD